MIIKYDIVLNVVTSKAYNVLAALNSTYVLLKPSTFQNNELLNEGILNARLMIISDNKSEI